MANVREERGRRERVMVVSPKNLRSTLRGLPYLVSAWDELGFDGRYYATNTWDGDIQDLEFTARQYVEGELPEDEGQEYLSLVAETKALLPLAARIGLLGPRWPAGHPDVAPAETNYPKGWKGEPMGRGDEDARVESGIQAVFKDPSSRPLEPTDDTKARWEALGKDRNRDPEYMRYLQSRRSPESLAESGREGFRTTSEKYGYDAAMEYAARFWREHPERASEPERDMVELLRRLGQEPRTEQNGGGDYERIYKGAPGVWVDNAWPEERKAIEVWGGVHTREFRERVAPEKVEEAEKRDAQRLEMLQERGWTIKVVMAHELKGDRTDETERHVRNFLDPNTGREVFIPGVFEPAERSREAERYRQEQEVEKLLLERDQIAGWEYAREFRVLKDERPVGFAWLDTKRAAELYPNEREAEADTLRRQAFAQKGWETLVLTTDRDLSPERREITGDALVRWARRGNPDRPVDQEAYSAEVSTARSEGRLAPERRHDDDIPF